MLPAISQDLQVSDVITTRNLKKLHRLHGPIVTNVINRMELTRSAEEFGASLRLWEIAILLHVDDRNALVKNLILNGDKLGEFVNFFRSDGRERIFVFFEHISKVESCDYHVTKAAETDGDAYVSKVEYGTSFLISMTADRAFGTKEEEIKIGEKTNMALHHVLSGTSPNFDFLEGQVIHVNVLRNWTELIISNERLETALKKIPDYITNTMIRYSIEHLPGATIDRSNIGEFEVLTIVDLLMDIRTKRNQITRDVRAENELPRTALSSSHHDADGLLKAVKAAIRELENSEGITKKFFLEVVTLADLVILFIQEEFHRVLESGNSFSSRDVELCEKTCFLLVRLHEKLIQGNYTYREGMLFAQLSTVAELDSLFTNTLVICFDYRADLASFKEWYNLDVIWASLRSFDFEEELILQRLRGAWLGFGWINPGNSIEPASPGSDKIYMDVCPENRNGRKRLFRCCKCQTPVRERSKGRLICDCGSFLEKRALYKCLRRSHIDWVPFFEEEEVKPEPPKKVVRPPSPEPPKKVVRPPSPEPPKRTPSPPKRHPDPIILPTNGEHLSKKNPVNIVFVGPKSAGKSTLINAMAYYCTHFHFSNVNHNIPQIPFKFTVTDDSGKEFVIQSKGELEANGSATFPSDSNGFEKIDRTGHQPGKDHDFFWQKQYFRLFDTIGVKSVDESPNALKDITDTLAKVKTVHGLCIIIPAHDQLPEPNEWYFALAKAISPELLKKAYFIFVGTEDVDKCKNAAAFIKFLRRNWIHLDWDKLLGIDNSCFLYLCAKHAGIEVPEMKLTQKEAWWNARSHIVTLINRIA
ncbi:hypothetical protein FO519_009339 [Halicephalobus sp. NKZ332]|nr:hypothetical protein FO519_009339 [Halicephalobus sp. NKZ332]